MYIAICVMLCGIIIGHLTTRIHFFQHLGKLVLPAILLLLFLLGTGIGANEKIMGALPSIGGAAFVLTILGMAGSIICTLIIAPLLKNTRYGKDR